MYQEGVPWYHGTIRISGRDREADRNKATPPHPTKISRPPGGCVPTNHRQLAERMAKRTTSAQTSPTVHIRGGVKKGLNCRNSRVFVQFEVFFNERSVRSKEGGGRLFKKV